MPFGHPSVLAQDSGGDPSTRRENERPTITITEILNGRKTTVGDFAQEPDPDQAMRLFIDTKENWGGGALNGAHYDEQRVKITVRIEPDDTDITDLYVRWEIYDPDDPATHADIDANANGGDNTGNAHEGAGFWYTKADHDYYKPGADNPKNTPAVDQTTVIGEARTKITKVDGKNLSTIFFNFSDDGGDNYQVKAILVDNEGTDSLGDDTDLDDDQSATLTVWRKRFVHVYGMDSNTDDVQVIVPGNGKANADAVTTGADGICDTAKAGDDVELIAFGKGKPGEVCVAAGPDGTLDSTAAGDDVVVGATITTGPDGICQTVVANDDVQVIDVGKGKANAVCIDTGADGVSNSTKANDDGQTIAVGNGKPNEVCISEGANGVLDTSPAGDDAVAGTKINTGANGICETNSATFYASEGGSIGGVSDYLKVGYSDVSNPNRNPYYDFDVSSGGAALAYQGDLRADIVGAGSLAQWLQDTLHAADDTHGDSTYDVIGVRRLSLGAANANNLPATSRHNPHATMNMGMLRTWAGANSINGVSTHEVAHNIGIHGADLHGNHSAAGGGGFDTCIGNTSPAIAAKPAYFCPKHVRKLRENAARAWLNHDQTVAIQQENTRDSD